MVPTFRSKDGLFSEGGKEMFFHTSTPTEEMQQSRKLGELAEKMIHAVPTPFHHILADLSERGKLHRLYTQNIGELDTCFEYLKADLYEKACFQKVANPHIWTIQLHGGMRTTRCHIAGHIDQLNPQALINGRQETLLCAPCSIRSAEQARKRRKRRKRMGLGLGIKEANIVMYNKNPNDNKSERDTGFIQYDADKVPVDLVIVCGTGATLVGIKDLIKTMSTNRASLWINTEEPPKIPGFTFTHK
ncbi:hypothetical protein HYALB_00008737 [Hymenoscyphus albidus]|uniref:Deacetylase sirtuin-type domain-containing protein n=1 Tax=Hymenoscyphus albidus TaxID=595503 RepID=A0A9N9LR91_9HELO|nr:hypothetical protein HYALB_00008737 [Hymenoscyphus albidus]